MLLAKDALHRLCRARDLLCAPGEGGPRVREVARAVGISRAHFIRLFRAAFGATPHQLRIRARLERARHLLALDRHSVTDVCLELGFSSLGSFSALFTRHVGQTPTTYRRRLRALARPAGALPEDLVPGCLSLMGHLPPSALRTFREA